MPIRVIVIGAGFAGLSAARELTQRGVEAVVVEARDRVGGRVEGGELGGYPVELGGTWVGDGHTEMNRLIRELGLETFPTYDEGKILVQLQGRRSEVDGLRSVPKLHPVALADLAQGLVRFNRLSRQVDPGTPWTHHKAATWDGQTFETWVRRNLRTPSGRSYFRVSIEALFSTDASDLSLLHVLAYAASNGGLEKALATTDGAQQDRIVGGSARLAERMADGLDVRLNSEVDTVAHSNSGVAVTTRSGERFDGDQVIVTLPPALAGRLRYEPVLPAWRDQLTQRVPAGTVAKVFAAYPTPFWREDGLNGQVAADAGPVKITFDVSPPGAEIGVLLGFVEAGEARRWQRLDAQQRRRQVLECFSTYFGPRAEHPTAYQEKDWSEEVFSRGCYGGFFGPGVWTAYGDALRTPVGRIHWAGAEYAEQWAGYMEGAVRSGASVAARLAPSSQSGADGSLPVRGQGH